MYQKILLCVDLHDEASWRKSLPAAVEICQSFGAELHILTVVPDLPSGVLELYLPEGRAVNLIRESDTSLAEFVSRHLAKSPTAHQHVGQGTVYRVILVTAGTIGADLIVMGSHSPAMSDFMLGPNAARVVRHSDRSVLVVRE